MTFQLTPASKHEPMFVLAREPLRLINKSVHAFLTTAKERI